MLRFNLYRKRKFVFLGRQTINGTLFDVCRLSKHAHLWLLHIFPRRQCCGSPSLFT